MTSNESRKRKRVSKNKKKSWRKTDIDDVEEYVEEHRLEERTGGPVASKTDTDLFFVDKDVEIETPVPVKRKKEVKPLKCHAILELDSKIKPIKISQNAVTMEKVIPVSKTILSASTNNKALKRKQKIEEKRNAVIERKNAKRLERQSKKNVGKDLWTDNEKEETFDSFHNLYTRKTRPKPPKHLTEKTSAVSAVEPALPGQSYNPTFEDHQELIIKAAIKEQVKVDAQQKITRSMTQKFPSLLEAPTEKTYIDEMSVGLFGEGEPQQKFTEEELSKISINPPVRREDKKTKKQRRKEEERKQQEGQHRLKKEEKLRKNEYFRIKSIKKELNRRDADLKVRAERKADMKEQNKDAPKRLSKYKYEEPALEVKLSDELEGSLRQLKPEGHLLLDRFKSLQRRNIIEPRQFLKKEKRRKSTKWAEKKGHKEITA